MKKIDILHTTVLIVAILCGYAALQAFLGLLNAVFYISDIFYARSGVGPVALPALIGACTYLIACAVLVKNSKRIANYLMGGKKQEYEEFLEDDSSEETLPPPAETTEPKIPEPAADPDTAEWHLDRRSILFALFIGIGLYTMIESIPALINGLFTQFKGQSISGAMELIRPTRKDSMLLELLRITLGALLVYAAPTLTNLIESTISPRLHNLPKSA